MRVGAIMYDRKNGEPIVILNDLEKRRALPIWVGVPEARAINMAAKGMQTIRPLTHELLNTTIERLGFLVKEVVIDQIQEGSFAASILLVNDHLHETILEARPSDAIALAMVADAPLYVSLDVLVQSSVPIEDDETEDFKEFVSSVKASDFNLLEPVQLPDDESTGEDAA